MNLEGALKQESGDESQEEKKPVGEMEWDEVKAELEGFGVIMERDFYYSDEQKEAKRKMLKGLRSGEIEAEEANPESGGKGEEDDGERGFWKK